MLGIDQIKEAIDNKKIYIGYSFYYQDDKLCLYPSEQSFSQVSMDSHLYSDRLKLTLGPIIRVLRSNRISSKHRFKRHAHYYDVRTNNNVYVLRPKESVIILTNERIMLSADIAAIILPRISLSDVGIVVTPAYIDPLYNGVLRLHIINQSDKSFELRTLECIAQCFFFKLSSPVPQIFREQFPEKSVFFAQTWHSIMTEDRDPFPTKKSPSENEDDWRIQLKNILCAVREWIKKKGVYFIFIGLLVGYSQLSQKIDSILKLSNNFSPSSATINIEPGTLEGEKVISYPLDKAQIITVVCNNDDVTSGRCNGCGI